MRGVIRFQARTVLAFSCFVFLCATYDVHARDATCVGGDGNFSVAFRTGVAVHIGATKKDGFAVHACDASLTWDDHSLTVASGVALVDLDAFGVDLGVGEPVVAFEVHESDQDCCSAYKIYSLQKPPRLLRTIAGESFFSASDIDLDGRVEIWTDDASAVQGFENLSVAELDFAPPVVLRFDNNRLLDVGLEFQTHFDDLIAKLKAELTPEDILDFKGSDGKLLPTSTAPVEYMHELRRVKIKILEIVWAYLYSGREDDAWKALANYWPATDIERVRVGLTELRKNGIRSQIDGVSSAGVSRKKKRAQVFDILFGPEHGPSQLIPPMPILIRAPPPSADHGLANSDAVLDLLIDSAGKVRSAATENAKVADPRLTDNAMQWKFIPAFRSDRPVACNLRFAISAKK
jgi:hypothetical protein